MVNARGFVRWQVGAHRDWFAGRCRLVWTRSFPFAGFEYRLPSWSAEREKEPAS